MNGYDDEPPPPYEAQDPLPTIAALILNQTVESKFYHVYRSHSGNYSLLDDDPKLYFYINSRSLRTSDLTIHCGNGYYDCEIANCKFPEFGTYYEMNFFREVNDPASIVQTKMTWDRHFTATIPVLDMARAATISASRPFRWEQTDGPMLVDAETNKVAAVMHRVVFGVPKCFVLETKVLHGYEFEVLMVVSAMAMYESRRREGPKLTSRTLRGFRTGP